MAESVTSHKAKVAGAVNEPGVTCKSGIGNGETDILNDEVVSSQRTLFNKLCVALL